MNHDPEPLRFDLDADPEPIHWIVEGLLEAGTICVLSGDTSAGKSQLALALAAAMLTGGTWLGQDVPRGRVLYIDGENYGRIVNDRLRAFGVTNAQLDGLRYHLRDGVLLGDPDWDYWLRKVTREHAADLIVIDTASSVVGADPNSNQDVCALYRDALRPATEDGATVLLLCHERKPSPDGHRGSGSLATMGARAWAHQADSHITMRATGELEETQLEDGRTAQRFPFELEFPKTRDGVVATRTRRWVVVSERTSRPGYRLEWQRIERDDSPDKRLAAREAAAADWDERVLDAIEKHGVGMRRGEIAVAISVNPKDGSLGRTLKRLVDDGRLVQSTGSPATYEVAR